MIKLMLPLLMLFCMTTFVSAQENGLIDSSNNVTETIKPILITDSNSTKPPVNNNFLPAPGQFNSVCFGPDGTTLLDVIYWGRIAFTLDQYSDTPGLSYPKNNWKSMDGMMDELVWYKDRLYWKRTPPKSERRWYDGQTRYELCFSIGPTVFMPHWGIEKGLIDSTDVGIKKGYGPRMWNFNISPIAIDQSEFKKADRSDLQEYIEKMLVGTGSSTETRSKDEDNDE